MSKKPRFRPLCDSNMLNSLKTALQDFHHFFFHHFHKNRVGKMPVSSNINDVIGPVLNFLFFFYDKISQAQKMIKTQFQFVINVAWQLI